ncbi:hypothetical protein [Nocardia colli]|uniref:hypothetical protein n=1 Tax=Nocardia colli TaxID=2545717 RepID=UPI0035D77253
MIARRFGAYPIQGVDPAEAQRKSRGRKLFHGLPELFGDLPLAVELTLLSPARDIFLQLPPGDVRTGEYGDTADGLEEGGPDLVERLRLVDRTYLVDLGAAQLSIENERRNHGHTDQQSGQEPEPGDKPKSPTAETD